MSHSEMWSLWARQHSSSSLRTEHKNAPGSGSSDSNNMKTSGMRRALALANIFNLLVAIYFIVISIISLIHLRWYHRLTITTKVRHIITSTTSYFAFMIILAVAVVLVAIFIIGTSKLSTKIYISSFRNNQNETTSVPIGPPTSSSGAAVVVAPHETGGGGAAAAGGGGDGPQRQDSVAHQRRRLLADSHHPVACDGSERFDIMRDSGSSGPTKCDGGDSSNFCSMLMNLIAAIGLIVIIVIWLLNTGELVRDSISTQLDFAFTRYQFSNRSNHYSVAIDAMQNINNCCGSLDYTDFPHQRMSGLSTGHYPGSCCGKSVFGVMARVLCSPEEIVRARQTTGCVIAIANHYDLVSLLIVPVALASLFVCIMVMAMMTLLRSHDSILHHEHHHLGGPSQGNLIQNSRFISTPDKLELNTTKATSSSSSSSSNNNNNINNINNINNNSNNDNDNDNRVKGPDNQPTKT